MDSAVSRIPPSRLTVEQAAQALNCSRAFLYLRIRAGDIRAQRDGRRRYVSVAEISRYVAARDAAA